MTALILLVGTPVAWTLAMVTRDWIESRRNTRAAAAHRRAVEAHEIHLDLVWERSTLEQRLDGIMRDTLRATLGDDYPEQTPIHDDTLLTVFDAELHAVDGPDDLGWTL